MPDLDPLPHRPSAPVLRPRSGDYAGVVTRARHRRRRHAGTAGAGLAGLTAVLVLAGGGVPGTHSLQPAPPARDGAGTGFAPAVSPAATPPAPSASASGGGRDAARPVPSGTAVAVPPAGTPAPPPPPAPSVTSAPVIRPVVTRDDIPDDQSLGCASHTELLAAGWCLRYSGPTTVRAGDPHEYRQLACRILGRGDATIGFPGEQQVEFAVARQGTPVWRWSKAYPFPQRRTEVLVGDGRCVRWTITWATVGDDGVPVAPGEYGMTPGILADVWGGSWFGAYSSTYGVTVTT